MKYKKLDMWKNQLSNNSWYCVVQNLTVPKKYWITGTNQIMTEEEITITRKKNISKETCCTSLK